MLIDYLPILIYMVIAVGLVALIVLMSEFLGTKRHTPLKDLPYECGMEPIGDARHRYAVRFYVIAMFFIVFDIEAIFFYPWGVVFKPLGWFGFVEMFVFVAILVVGLIYVWGKGALEWE
jgi:NADH-quinone oxidoreductase subunit A